VLASVQSTLTSLGGQTRPLMQAGAELTAKLAHLSIRRDGAPRGLTGNAVQSRGCPCNC